MVKRSSKGYEGIWSYLPPQAQTLGAYLRDVSLVADVRLSQLDDLGVFVEEVIIVASDVKSPTIKQNAFDQCTTPPFSPMKSISRAQPTSFNRTPVNTSANRFNSRESWPAFLRSMQLMVCDGHCLNETQTILFLAEQKKWSKLREIIGTSLVRQILIKCVVIQRLGNSNKFLQIAGPVITKEDLSILPSALTMSSGSGHPNGPTSGPPVSPKSHNPHVHSRSVSPARQNGIFPSLDGILNVEISWRRMLYVANFDKRNPLGKRNIFENDFGCFVRALISEEIIGVNLMWLESLFDEIRLNIREYDFARELEIHAPFNLSDIKRLSPMTCLREINAVDDYSVPATKARGIILNMVDDLLPDTWFITVQNKRRFLENVKTVLSMGSQDVVQFSRLVDGMKSSPVTAVMKSYSDNVSESHGKCVLVNLARVAWYFIVQRIVKFSFYATDGVNNGTAVYFFRKNVWHLLTNKAMKGYIEFIKLTPAECDGHDCSLRWLPKSKGMRPIAKQVPQLKGRSRVLLTVLKAIRSAHPETIGHSVMTRDEAFGRLRFSLGKLGSGPYYVFTADIRNCYESIKHEELFYLFDTVREDVTFAFANFRVFSLTSHSRVPARTKTLAYQENDISGCMDQLSFGNALTLITPKGGWTSKPKQWREIAHDLKTIVRNWTFKYGNKKYRIGSTGLVQGSSLAGALAAFYYGGVDRAMNQVIPSNVVMLRLVDDFLCISNTQESAEYVANIIENTGMYGSVNKNKSTGNFGLYEKNLAWTGFGINPSETRLNFSLAESSESKIKETLIIKSAYVNDNKAAMAESLARSQRQKLLPILLDRALNTEISIRKNVIFAGVASAARVCAIARAHKKFHGRSFPIREVADTLLQPRHFRLFDPTMKKLFLKSFLRRLKRENII